MTLTTNELQLFADLLDERGIEPLLLDRIRHEITAREAIDGQLDALVDAYGDTVVTRWPDLEQAWRQPYGLRDIVKNVAVDASDIGHAEGRSCSCREENPAVATVVAELRARLAVDRAGAQRLLPGLEVDLGELTERDRAAVLAQFEI